MPRAADGNHLIIPVVPASLAPLVRYLDNLTGRASLNTLSDRLRESCVTLDAVRDYLRFDPHR